MVTIMETGQTLMDTSNTNNQTLMDTSSNVENGLLSGMQNSDEEDDDDMSTGSLGDSDNEEFQDSAALMAAAMGDEVTAQLAAAGPVGMAAAAAIVSAKKRKRPHSFETNPSIRKRQQNRLLRKLKLTIDEFATRVGQQAVVLVTTPGKPSSTSFKCFGAKPLEDVVKNLRSMIMDELEAALAQQAPPPIPEDPSLYELPPLIIDGIPTPVEKMTQAQLRAFIPLMLKYSTGRGKPGWGRESTRPPWWPKDLPWANVRMDARTEEEKQKISWTHALRQIVINCYKFHGREDLLPAFTDDDDSGLVDIKPNLSQSQHVGVLKYHKSDNSQQQQQVSIKPNLGQSQHVGVLKYHKSDNSQQQQQVTSYASTVLSTITNPDGTVSIIQVDPNNPIITLPDGTTAHVQGVATSLDGQGDGVSVDLNSVTEATLNQDGQIILTGEDGRGYPVSVSGMVTIPSMYQTVVANIQQIHTQSDGTMQIVPAMHVKGEGGGGGEGGEVETITVTPHQIVAMGNGGEAQVLQVISLKDGTAFTKALQVQMAQEIKTEDGGGGGQLE